MAQRLAISILAAIVGGFVCGPYGMGTLVAAQTPGGAQKAPQSAEVVPFKIQVPDAVLVDLKERLAKARFADEIPGSGWDYGTNREYLEELIAYWRNQYDWRTQERALNQFSQFKTNIDGLNLHFIHQRSPVPTARPLLLLNGWPSSIEEYVKVIGPLTDPAKFGGRTEDAFHVVIPAMPGYGFSDKPRDRGWDRERMAQLWQKLMARLGYTRYGLHGSDWGASIAATLAFRDPDVAALHLIGCGGGAPPPDTPESRLRARLLQVSHSGYVEIQSTRPQTLGQGLSDSPVGLASWILDKWHAWSDHDGNIEKAYTKDELLNNIMIYWITNTGTSSARLYYEVRHVNGRQLRPELGDGMRPKGRVTVPTGCAEFQNRYDRHPGQAASGGTSKGSENLRYNLVHAVTMPRGGHFAALEQPQLWLDDIRTFFRNRF